MSTDEESIHRYYQRGEEQERLLDGVGRLEYLRTQELISRHLPERGGRIADIGGGPGRYSLWLAGLGYDMVHRDLVPLHVEQLRTSDGAAHINSAVGDARQLELEDGCVDATLLLGPLYHLGTRAERLAALSEARRITRPGGAIFVAAISRWAPRLDGILRLRLYETHPEVLEDCPQTERTGVLPPLYPSSFTAFCHRPTQLAGELRAASLTLLSLVAVEGFAFGLEDLEERLDDAHACSVLLDSLRSLEAVPELLGIGPHLLATARRPQ